MGEILGEATDIPKSDFKVLFKDNSHIDLSTPKFSDNFLEAVHPILGKCKIELRAIRQLTKHSPENKEE